MGKEVTFDYSKAAEFVSAEEMANFKTTVMAAKDTLLGETGREMIFWDGSTCRWTMIRMNLPESRRQRPRSSRISDVLLVVGIGGSYLGARAAIEFLSTASTMYCPRAFARHRRFISLGTASAASILRI